MTNTKENISIRGFREDEWSLLRGKRLEAVRAHAHLYLRNFETEAAFPESHWRDMIASPNGKVFGLFDGETLIGLTGVYLNRHDDSRKSVLLGMSYIDPAYRRLGLSRLFYEVRLDWARAAGYERAIVSHRAGNEPSRRANAAFGFKWINSEEGTFGDGSIDIDHRYELRL